MVLVFDQMRAEYIDRFELKNFQRARKLGVDFKNGIVGHLESNTVISHPVITTGKFPRNMPWGVQMMKDVHGYLGQPGLYYAPFGLTTEQWFELHRLTSDDTSLLARVKSARPGPTFAVAQKLYAAFNFGGPYADHIITLGSVGEDGRHSVDGVAIPSYIKGDKRYLIEGRDDWGSGGMPYSLHGAGYVTGVEPDRPGGDAWVGDVVEEIMAEESDWSAILASFGAIDKVSHVLAEHDEPTMQSWAVSRGISLEGTLHKADHELGRILDRLESTGLMQETVVVITADHGGQCSSSFQGRQTPGRHRWDGYYGKGVNFDYTGDPTPALKPVLETGWVEAGCMNTMLSFWTRELNPAQRLEFGERLARCGGVAEVYGKGPSGYELLFQNPKLEGKELDWARQHHAALVDTLNGPGGPDFIGLLFDKTGYSIKGGHGGAQEMCQRIPMLVLAPNVQHGISSESWVRLVDVNPIIGRLLGLDSHSGLDGTFEAIEPYRD